VGTLNLLNACRRADVEKVIHTSTSEVYGTAQFVPIDESHPLVTQSPYSASKIGADMIALSYYYSYGLSVSVIRPFNTFGPRQSTRAVIPTIVTQALSGSTVKLGDIGTTRDFTFVKDTVNGFLKIAENDISVGKIINIGSGFEISIEHIVKHVGNILGKKIKIETEELRKRPEKSEVMRLIADNSRAKELIGWEPCYTFEDGLKETVEWYKDNLDECNEGYYNI
jgi:dTDP-glucose 4,6-dehydratase